MAKGIIANNCRGCAIQARVGTPALSILLQALTAMPLTDQDDAEDVILTTLAFAASDLSTIATALEAEGLSKGSALGSLEGVRARLEALSTFVANYTETCFAAAGAQ